MNNGFSTTIVRGRPWWRSVAETFFGVSKRELIQRMNALERSNLELAAAEKAARDLSNSAINKNWNLHFALAAIAAETHRLDGPKVRRLIKIAADAIADKS